MTASARFVVTPSADGGPPRVERAVAWQIAGAAPATLTPLETRDDFMLDLRDAGVGPEPVVCYSADGDEPRLIWPDLGAHAVDPEHARLVALASAPIFDRVPELADTPEPDAEHLAEVERLVEQDRAERAFLVRLVEAVAPKFVRQRAALRLASRKRRPPPKPPKRQPDPSPNVFLDGELTEQGWRWTRRASGSQPHARARLRR